MTRLSLDRDSTQKLSQCREAVSIVDSEGRSIGTFLPFLFRAEPDEEWPPVLSEEDLRERLAGPLYTTEEVLARLRALS